MAEAVVMRQAMLNKVLEKVMVLFGRVDDVLIPSIIQMRIIINKI
jgi:hypothetical protein